MKTRTYYINDDRYDIPESDVVKFLSDAAANRLSPREGIKYNRGSETWIVPADETKDFQTAVPGATRALDKDEAKHAPYSPLAIIREAPVNPVDRFIKQSTNQGFANYAADEKKLTSGIASNLQTSARTKSNEELRASGEYDAILNWNKEHPGSQIEYTKPDPMKEIRRKGEAALGDTPSAGNASAARDTEMASYEPKQPRNTEPPYMVQALMRQQSEIDRQLLRASARRGAWTVDESTAYAKLLRKSGEIDSQMNAAWAGLTVDQYLIGEAIADYRDDHPIVGHSLLPLFVGVYNIATGPARMFTPGEVLAEISKGIQYGASKDANLLETLAWSTFQSLPQTITAMMSTAQGHPEIGFGLMAADIAASNIKDIYDDRQIGLLSAAEAEGMYVSAVFNGLVQSAIEMATTGKQMSIWKNAWREGGKDVLDRVVRGEIKKLFSTSAKQFAQTQLLGGLTEAGEELAQNITDRVIRSATGQQVSSAEEWGKELVMDAIGGFVGGVIFGSVQTGYNMRLQSKTAQAIEYNATRYPESVAHLKQAIIEIQNGNTDAAEGELRQALIGEEYDKVAKSSPEIQRGYNLAMDAIRMNKIASAFTTAQRAQDLKSSIRSIEQELQNLKQKEADNAGLNDEDTDTRYLLEDRLKVNEAELREHERTIKADKIESEIFARLMEISKIEQQIKQIANDYPNNPEAQYKAGIQALRDARVSKIDANKRASRALGELASGEQHGIGMESMAQTETKYPMTTEMGRLNDTQNENGIPGSRPGNATDQEQPKFEFDESEIPGETPQEKRTNAIKVQRALDLAREYEFKPDDSWSRANRRRDIKKWLDNYDKYPDTMTEYAEQAERYRAEMKAIDRFNRIMREVYGATPKLPTIKTQATGEQTRPKKKRIITWKELDNLPHLRAMYGRTFAKGEGEYFADIWVEGAGWLVNLDDEHDDSDTIHEKHVETPIGERGMANADSSEIIEAAKQEWLTRKPVTDIYDEAKLNEQEAARDAAMNELRDRYENTTDPDERAQILDDWNRLTDLNIEGLMEETGETEYPEGYDETAEMDEEDEDASFDFGEDEDAPRYKKTEAQGKPSREEAVDALKAAVGFNPKTDKITHGTNGSVTIDLADGRRIVLNQVDEIAIYDPVTGEYQGQAAGRTRRRLMASGKVQIIIDLVNDFNGGNRAGYHENFHMAWYLFSTPEQRQFLTDYYTKKILAGEAFDENGEIIKMTSEQWNKLSSGARSLHIEEQAAQGSEAWNGQRRDHVPSMVNRIWQRIMDKWRWFLIKIHKASDDQKLEEIFHLASTGKLGGEGTPVGSAQNMKRVPSISSQMQMNKVEVPSSLPEWVSVAVHSFKRHFEGYRIDELRKALAKATDRDDILYYRNAIRLNFDTWKNDWENVTLPWLREMEGRRAVDAQPIIDAIEHDIALIEEIVHPQAEKDAELAEYNERLARAGLEPVTRYKLIPEQNTKGFDEIANPIDSALSKREKIRQLKALTAENQSKVDRLCQLVDKKLKNSTSKPNEKTYGSIYMKSKRPEILMEHPNFDVEYIRDGLRFKTTISDPRDMVQIARILDKEGIGVVKFDWNKMFRPKEWGFRIASFDLRMPNGQIVEYYTPVQEIEAVKDEAHKIFEKWRTKDDEYKLQHRSDYQADRERSRELYSNAWSAFLTRIGKSETEFKASFTSAIASFDVSTGSKLNSESSTAQKPSLQTPALSRIRATSIRGESSGTLAGMISARPEGATATYKSDKFIPTSSKSMPEKQKAEKSQGISKEEDSTGDTRHKVIPTQAETAEAERQYAEVEAKYRGTDAWMKAPNGKPTNLNERQWVQVRTPAFKAWFGDWENDPKNASKVVDENGEPMVVWHTTNDDPFYEFNTFSTSKLGKFFGNGSYFSQRANAYYGKNTIGVFLNIRNPVYFTDFMKEDASRYPWLKRLHMNDWMEWNDRRLYAMLRQQPFNEKEPPKTIVQYNKTVGGYPGWQGMGHAFNPRSLRTAISKEQGYDGIVVDSVMGEILTDVDQGKEFVVYKSTQIKSATGNVGTFDPENADIRYKVGPAYHGSGAAFDKFDMKFVGTGEGVQAFGFGIYISQREGVGRSYADSIGGQKRRSFVYRNNYLNSAKQMTDRVIDELASQKTYSYNDRVITLFGVDYSISKTGYEADLYAGESMIEAIMARKHPELKRRWSDKWRSADNRYRAIIMSIVESTFYAKNTLTKEQIIKEINRATDWIKVNWREDRSKDAEYLISLVNSGDMTLSSKKKTLPVPAIITSNTELVKEITARHAQWMDENLSERKPYDFNIMISSYAENHDHDYGSIPDDARLAIARMMGRYGDWTSKESGRNLYTVSVWADKQEDVLDWYGKPTQEQIDKIALQFAKDGRKGAETFLAEMKTGEELYHTVGHRLRLSKNDKDTSEFLLRAGIDGIKYPVNALSGGEGEKGYNYVVFDANEIVIEEHIQYKRISEEMVQRMDRVRAMMENQHNAAQQQTQKMVAELKERGFDPKQVEEKLGRQMRAAFREAASEVNTLLAASKITGFEQWIVDNKPINQGDLTFHNDEAIEYAKQMGMDGMEAADLLGGDGYTWYLHGLQVFMTGNQHLREYTDVVEQIRQQAEKGMVDPALQEKKLILAGLIGQYSKAWDLMKTNAGRLLQAAKARKIEQIRNFSLISESITEDVQRLKREVETLEAELQEALTIQDEIDAMIAELQNAYDALIVQLDAMGMHMPAPGSDINRDAASNLRTQADAIKEKLDAMRARQAENLHRIQEMRDGIARRTEMIKVGAQTIIDQIDPLIEPKKPGRKPRAPKIHDIVPTAPTWYDIAKSNYYQNILSSPMTHYRNITGNISNLMAELMVNWLTTGKDGGVSLQGMLKHALEAAQVSKETFANASEYLKKYDLQDSKNLTKAMKFFTGITRLLAAEDAFFFHLAFNMQLQNLAAVQAKTRGEKRSFEQILQDALGIYEQSKTEAQKTNHTLEDVIYRSLSTPDIIKQAYYEAKRMTYNQNPEGLMGIANTAIEKFIHGLEHDGYQAAALAFKFTVMPFTRIVANVTNFGIDWSPLGFVRAYEYAKHGKSISAQQGIWTDENGKPALSPYQKRDLARQLARAILGTLAMIMAMTLLRGRISGGGPRDKDERQRLMAAGWRPYSIKIGERWIPYNDLWFSTVLAVAGNLNDYSEYNKGYVPKSGWDQATYAMMGVSRTFLDKSFLGGMSDTFAAVSRQDPKFITRSVANVPGNIIPYANGLRWLNDLFYHQQHAPETIAQYLAMNARPLTTPWLKQAVPISVDEFGQPIKKASSLAPVIGTPVREGQPFYVYDAQNMPRNIRDIINAVNRQQLEFPSMRMELKLGDEYITLRGFDKQRMLQLRGRELSLGAIDHHDEILRLSEANDRDAMDKLLRKIGDKASDRAREYYRDILLDEDKINLKARDPGGKPLLVHKYKIYTKEKE